MAAASVDSSSARQSSATVLGGGGGAGPVGIGKRDALSRKIGDRRLASAPTIDAPAAAASQALIARRAQAA
jgi:hypothetical protein